MQVAAGQRSHEPSSPGQARVAFLCISSFEPSVFVVPVANIDCMVAKTTRCQPEMQAPLLSREPGSTVPVAEYIIPRSIIEIVSIFFVSTQRRRYDQIHSSIQVTSLAILL